MNRYCCQMLIVMGIAVLAALSMDGQSGVGCYPPYCDPEQIVPPTRISDLRGLSPNEVWRWPQTDIKLLTRAPYNISNPTQLAFVLNPKDHAVLLNGLTLNIYSKGKLVYSVPSEATRHPGGIKPIELRAGRMSDNLLVIVSAAAAKARPFFKPGNTIAIEANFGSNPGKIEGAFLSVAQ